VVRHNGRRFRLSQATVADWASEEEDNGGAGADNNGDPGVSERGMRG